MMTIRELKLLVSTVNYASYTIVTRFGTVLYKNASWEDIKSKDKDCVIHRATPRGLDSGECSVSKWYIILA